MPRLNRFYCPNLPAEAGAHAVLDAEESHHLASVLRMEMGARVELFDGAGRAAPAEVTAADRKAVELRLLHAPQSSAEAERGGAFQGETSIDPTFSALESQPQIFALTVALAPAKGAFDDAVTQLAELGAARVMPLLTRYGEVDPARHGAEKFAVRMKRLAVAAAKQCGRNTLLEVAPPAPIEAVSGRTIVCDTGGEREALADIAARLADGAAAYPVALTLLIGPEGGWSVEERTFFRDRGWPVASLPGFVLRTPTAAVAAAAIVLATRRS